MNALPSAGPIHAYANRIAFSPSFERGEPLLLGPPLGFCSCLPCFTRLDDCPRPLLAIPSVIVYQALEAVAAIEQFVAYLSRPVRNINWLSMQTATRSSVIVGSRMMFLMPSHAAAGVGRWRSEASGWVEVSILASIARLDMPPLSCERRTRKQSCCERGHDDLLHGLYQSAVRIERSHTQ